MKKVLFLCLSLFLWGTAAPDQAYPNEFQAIVTHIIDGDTVKVRLKNKKSIIIHLDAIDCPERDQPPYGIRASQLTKALVQDQLVTIQVYYHYGKWLNDVILEGDRSLNQELVKAGLAWWNFKNSDDEQLAYLEFMAKIMRVGLWQDRDPIPPWDFRQTKRNPSKGRTPQPLFAR